MTRSGRNEKARSFSCRGHRRWCPANRRSIPVRSTRPGGCGCRNHFGQAAGATDHSLRQREALACRWAAGRRNRVENGSPGLSAVAVSANDDQRMRPTERTCRHTFGLIWNPDDIRPLAPCRRYGSSSTQSPVHLRHSSSIGRAPGPPSVGEDGAIFEPAERRNACTGCPDV